MKGGALDTSFQLCVKQQHRLIVDPPGICIYLLEFLGDAEAGVDPLSALCVFGLVVLQEVASGEFSCNESEQRQVCRQRGTKTLYHFMATILPLNYHLPAVRSDNVGFIAADHAGQIIPLSVQQLISQKRKKPHAPPT